MTESIELKRRDWLFEIYDSNESITTDKPTIALYVEPFSEGHNSTFPFKVLAAYYFKNPHSVFNNHPRFEIDGNKKILLLAHNYMDSENQLMSALRLMKIEFETEAFDNDGNNI